MATYTDQEASPPYRVLAALIAAYLERPLRKEQDGDLFDFYGAGPRGLLDALEAEILPALGDSYDQEFGPPISWKRRRPWGEDIVAHDWTGEADDAELEYGPYDRAASAYRRECGWDFSPGKAGVWLVARAPHSALGDHLRSYRGNLVGFLVLHDRDGDGKVESVAHLWTARRARRHGVAGRLLAEARRRYPLSQIEGPPTEDGVAFIRARALDLVLEDGRSEPEGDDG